MTRTAVLSLVALLLMPSTHGSAQELQPFEDLGLRINLGDELRVEDESGRGTTGRLVGLARDSLVIQSETGGTRFTGGGVHKVSVRRHALLKSALIGAGVVAGNRAPAAMPESERLVASNAVVSWFEGLASRVNLDDELSIEDQSGTRAVGRLTQLSPEGLTLRTPQGARTFTPAAVRRAVVRQRPLRAAVLLGAAAGAVTGAVLACTGTTREECPDGPILGGAFGADLGLIVGGLVRRTTVVLPEAAEKTSIVPVVSRDAAAVVITRSW